MSDDKILSIYPLTYNDVYERCKAEIDQFKKNQQFYKIMSQLKEDTTLAYRRKHHPQSKKSAETTLYSEKIMDEIKTIYRNRIIKKTALFLQ